MIKRSKLLGLFLLLCLGVFIMTACSDDDNDNDNGQTISPGDILNPEDLDPNEVHLYIAVADIQEDFGPHRYDYFEGFIHAVDPELRVNEIDVQINGTNVEAMGWQGTWYVDYDFETGENYLFEIEINDKEYSGTVTVPYPVSSISFPEDYNPAQTANVSWSLDNNNQTQVAYAHSAYFEDIHDEDSSHWFREINSSDREFNFPANIVTNFGEGTEYELGVVQVNYQLANNVISAGISDRNREYGEHWRTRKERTRELIKNSIEAIK